MALVDVSGEVCVEVIEELANIDEVPAETSTPVLEFELTSVASVLNPVADEPAKVIEEVLEVKPEPDPDIDPDDDVPDDPNIVADADEEKKDVAKLVKVVGRNDDVAPNDVEDPKELTTLAPQTCSNLTASPTSLFK